MRCEMEAMSTLRNADAEYGDVDAVDVEVDGA